MPDPFFIIEKLIASQITISPPNGDGLPRSVTLQEWDIRKDPVTQKVTEIRVISSVTVRDLPNQVFVFRADAFPQPQALFKEECAHARKRADFILLANEPGKKRIVYIEMKRSKDSENGIIAQLKGAACIMDYCNSVLKRFWGSDTCFVDFEERFVSLSDTMGKKTTRPDRNAPLHNTPDRLLKLKGHSFTYQELIRK